STITDSFNYTVSDGTLTDIAVLTITINRSEERRVGKEDIGTATEDGCNSNGTPGANATGNVLTNDTDVDNPTTSLSVSAIRTGSTEGSGTAGTVGTALTGAHGALTLNTDGTYTYVVNNSDAAVQALNVGSTITDSFNYTVSDGNLTDIATLTITINCADDAPIGVNDVGTATEAGGTSNGTPGANATVNVLTHDPDVDNPTTSLSVSAIRTGSSDCLGPPRTVSTLFPYTTLFRSLNTDGTYTYVVNNSDAAVQALNVGSTITDSFNYTVRSEERRVGKEGSIRRKADDETTDGVNDVCAATEAGGDAKGSGRAQRSGN